MSHNAKEVSFHSPLAPLMRQFIEEKRACGYRYHGQARLLACFDRALADEPVTASTLPRAATRRWLAKRSHVVSHFISPVISRFIPGEARPDFPD
jgi:hypothetical protein